MLNRMELTDTQRNTISHGLRLAAERYDEHVKTLCEMILDKRDNIFVRLAETFTKQAQEARQLASLFDECETVICQSATLIESFEDQSDSAKEK